MWINNMLIIYSYIKFKAHSIPVSLMLSDKENRDSDLGNVCEMVWPLWHEYEWE